jgi:signal transduction histidine kinase
MQSGAADYLIKDSLSDDLLIRTVAHAIQRQTETQLRRAQEELETTMGQLKAAKRKLFEQQERMGKENRLKVLLQMASDSAHQLSQPMMSLLCNIELIRMTGNDPTQFKQRLDKIETACRRITDIVKTMQNPRHR